MFTNNPFDDNPEIEEGLNLDISFCLFEWESLFVEELKLFTYYEETTPAA